MVLPGEVASHPTTTIDYRSKDSELVALKKYHPHKYVITPVARGIGNHLYEISQYRKEHGKIRLITESSDEATKNTGHAGAWGKARLASPRPSTNVFPGNTVAAIFFISPKWIITRFRTYFMPMLHITSRSVLILIIEKNSYGNSGVVAFSEVVH